MRQRMRDATARLPRVDGQLYRDGALIGSAGGVRYVKRLGGFTISLAGQIADQPDGEYLTVLYPDDPPAALEGDQLTIGDAEYTVLAVRDMTAYQTWRLEPIA